MTGWVKKRSCFPFCLIAPLQYIYFLFFLFSLIYPADLLSLSNLYHLCFVCLSSTPVLFFQDHPHAPYFASALCFLSFHLVLVNRSVVQDLVITPLSVRLLADYCRDRCAGLMLGYSHRLLAMLAEALYCVCLNVLIVTLYSTHLLYCTSLWGTFSHPSSLCPLFLRLRGSDGKVGREGRGPGTKLPLWRWLTGKLLYTDVTISKSGDQAADIQSG